MPDVSRVVVAAESAGAYMACLAARERVPADAYIFLGGFCSKALEMYEYNFGRLVDYAARSPENLDWALNHARRDLAMGRQFKAMFAAAKAGQQNFQLVDGDFRTTLGLARRREELQSPPDEMFRFIQTPAFALAGEEDLNVPPEHAARAVRVMRTAGNTNAIAGLIAGMDHSFQLAPADADLAFRERYTFDSFRRPYATNLYETIVTWLAVTLPRAPAAATTLATAPTSLPLRAATATEIDAKTDTTPRRVQLAPGIEIVDDITDRAATASVDTLEGRIGPLLLAEGCQAHFIDMPAGMFLAEHPHSTESLIYTVRGRWVLCSQGRHHLMQPGSLFRFGANIPTGYEVPFEQDAYILIFKGARSTRVEKDFIDYLQGMAARLQREHTNGTPFFLKELKPDHPARSFAREVNPRFEKNLAE